MVSDNNFYTLKEINTQPDLWLKISHLLKSYEKPVSNFLSHLLNKENLNIVLTGAGSSSFIGESIEHSFKESLNIPTRALSTTSLVTHFKNYISVENPLLLISFARSGNSPESNAVINLAEKYCNDVHHLIITCNKDGALSKRIDSVKNGLKIILPDEAEDRGLAMTGSFRGMMLTGLFVAWVNCMENKSEIISKISKVAKSFINNSSEEFKKYVTLDFNRIVFLGSGPLQSIARESHLKVQELTDGQVVGKFDSFLGFRHGPKAVVNNETILVFLFSSDDSVFQYEKDLVEQIIKDGIAKHCIGVFCDKEQANDLNLDQKIVFDLDEDQKKSDYHLLLYVIPSQIIGYYKSLDLGLNPDSPSQSNVISRVVEGVTIYPLN